MYKALIISLFISGVTMSQTSDEQFIMENMEMLEALEMLESEVEVDQLTMEEKTFANTDPKEKEEENENEKDL